VLTDRPSPALILFMQMLRLHVASPGRYEGMELSKKRDRPHEIATYNGDDKR
jgi:hypothetical protein